MQFNFDRFFTYLSYQQTYPNNFMTFTLFYLTTWSLSISGLALKLLPIQNCHRILILLHAPLTFSHFRAFDNGLISPRLDPTFFSSWRKTVLCQPEKVRSTIEEGVIFFSFFFLLLLNSDYSVTLLLSFFFLRASLGVVGDYVKKKAHSIGEFRQTTYLRANECKCHAMARWNVYTRVCVSRKHLLRDQRHISLPLVSMMEIESYNPWVSME